MRKLIQKSIIEYFEGSDVMRSKKIYGIGEKGEFLVLEYEMDDQDRIISITLSITCVSVNTCAAAKKATIA